VPYSGSNNFEPIGTLFIISILIAIGLGCWYQKKKADEARKVRNEAFAREVKLADPNRIDRANDGCPVFVKGGQLQVDGPPADPKF